MFTDIVCGMDVDKDRAIAENLVSDFKGRTYYFCCNECKLQFDAHPEQYIEHATTRAGEGEGLRAPGAAKGTASRSKQKSMGAKAKKTSSASGQKKQARAR